LLSAKQVAPGESGRIEVTVRTQGQTALHKSVVVLTNDPKQPQVALSITGTVVPEFGLSDRTIYFGSVPPGKEVVKDLLITIPPEKSVKVVSAESTDQYVSVQLEPVPGSNGKKVKLVATQKPDTKPGYHFGMVVVKTTSTLTPELRIPVRGIVATASQ
jgi:hypothetical protein